MYTYTVYIYGIWRYKTSPGNLFVLNSITCNQIGCAKYLDFTKYIHRN